MPRKMARPAAPCALLLLTALAFCIRALWLGDAFGPEGAVHFWGPDAAYHARRALYSFMRFPEVLWFDPYLAFPKGAIVPMPPLFDWAIAAVARCFGESEQAFERVAVW